MSMSDWAEREIQIAKSDKCLVGNGELCYNTSCYDSAYKAFKSLMGDGHTGMSIGITMSILNRLVNGHPLTPIKDTPDVWRDVSIQKMYKTYQCRRMSSLFKDVYKDGTVVYIDTDRVRLYCGDSDTPWCSGFITRLIHNMFPISMPYFGGQVYKVYGDEYLTDSKNGDYDTIAIRYVVCPDGTFEINKYFKEVGYTYEEITFEEFQKRVAMHQKRLDALDKISKDMQEKSNESVQAE